MEKIIAMVTCETCENCGKEFDFDEEGIEYQGDHFCDECIHNIFNICCECGEYIHCDDCLYDNNGDAYCEHCFDNCTFECENCGDIHNYSERMILGDYSLCDYCYENNYICCECGELISHYDTYFDDYDNCYCESCYNDRPPDTIHDYSYKPEAIFHGNTKRLFGTEIEADSGGCDNDNAREILDIMNGEDYVYMKQDSSLDNGFEIVSHPCTLDYHANYMNWKEAFNELSSMGYESHDAGTCGIHVHMNRAGFGETLQEQELGISKVLYFIERHWDNVVKFSRRTNRQLSDWANRYLSKIDDEKSYSPHEVLDYAKDDGSRYRAVNLCNRSTIEIRIFRGTLKYTSFMAILQFCDLLYDIAEMDLIEVISITWKDFIEMGGKYEEFTTYVAERNLA